MFNSVPSKTTYYFQGTRGYLPCELIIDKRQKLFIFDCVTLSGQVKKWENALMIVKNDFKNNKNENKT
jgi:hypothetical protein